nr:embryo-specific protein ATS3B [Ipomoea batatas]
MAMAKVYCVPLFSLILLFIPIIISEARSNSILSWPHPAPPSFAVNTTTLNHQNGKCSFTVDIRTSCYSTSTTRDQISLSFGDAYGNQVYAPRLDDPYSRTFERCSTDTFQIWGPCTYQICYVYVYRSGNDGWIPYDITIQGQGHYSRPVTFYYNVHVPRDMWYGFDYCSKATKAYAKWGWNLVSAFASTLYAIAGLERD